MPTPDITANPNQEAGFGGATEEAIPQALYDALESASLFERMLLIAGCRDPATGSYNSGPAAWFASPAIDEALRGLHLETFTSWLSLPLSRQKADIGIFLSRTTGSHHTVAVRQLVSMAERALPTAAQRTARDLFIRDVTTVQALLQQDY